MSQGILVAVMCVIVLGAVHLVAWIAGETVSSSVVTLCGMLGAHIALGHGSK